MVITFVIFIVVVVGRALLGLVWTVVERALVALRGTAVVDVG